MDDRKFITTDVFLNFLFRWTVSYQSYIWTMGKTEEHRTPFYFLFVFIVLFLLFKERRKKFRYLYLIGSCLGRVTYFALTACFILFFLHWFDSFLNGYWDSYWKFENNQKFRKLENHKSFFSIISDWLESTKIK